MRALYSASNRRRRGFSGTAGSGRCRPLPLLARGPLPPALSAAAVVGGIPVGPGAPSIPPTTASGVPNISWFSIACPPAFYSNREKAGVSPIIGTEGPAAALNRPRITGQTPAEVNLAFLPRFGGERRTLSREPPGPFWQVAGIVQPTLQQNARRTHKTKPKVTKRALVHSGLHKT